MTQDIFKGFGLHFLQRLLQKSPTPSDSSSLRLIPMKFGFYLNLSNVVL